MSKYFFISFLRFNVIIITTLYICTSFILIILQAQPYLSYQGKSAKLKREGCNCKYRYKYVLVVTNPTAQWIPILSQMDTILNILSHFFSLAIIELTHFGTVGTVKACFPNPLVAPVLV